MLGPRVWRDVPSAPFGIAGHPQGGQLLGGGLYNCAHGPAIQIVPSCWVIVHVVRGVPDAVMPDEHGHGDRYGLRDIDGSVARTALSHERKLFHLGRRTQGKGKAFGDQAFRTDPLTQ